MRGVLLLVVVEKYIYLDLGSQANDRSTEENPPEKSLTEVQISVPIQAPSRKIRLISQKHGTRYKTCILYLYSFPETVVTTCFP